MRWNLKKIENIDTIQHLALKVSPLIATLLAQRGITTYEEARKFLRPQWADLHNPFLMKDMDKAIARIEKALAQNERILVYGDYDVDGTTAVALMSEYLRNQGGEIDTYIPDRYTEGYGISFQGIDYAEDNGFTLIIALDCGIKAIDKIDYAKNKGIDFIICDHHTPGETIPDAIAVLDPKQKDCPYPYKELCGCGVGFKVIQALNQKRGGKTEELFRYLDLVATAIASDIVPITGENRVLAYFGLQIINTNPRKGLLALKKTYNIKEFTITDVVFKFAPKINAAGRMKHGNYAVQLLTEFDFEKAQQVCKEIENFNKKRKELDQQITQEALLQIEKNQETAAASTVVYSPNWHKGVIGIVASRLIEHYYRPTIVFTQSEGCISASARSVKGFDVYKALEACSEHLIQFGGHMYAAGMTCKPEKYHDFKQAFEKYVKENITSLQKEPEIEIDAVIDFSEIDEKTTNLLKYFEPHGPENMTPVFLAKGVRNTKNTKQIGKNNEHLRMEVVQKQSNVFTAIAFGQGVLYEEMKEYSLMNLVFSLDENEYNGQKTLQLQVKDIKLISQVENFLSNQNLL